MKEKTYKRKTEHMVRFWMNKLMQERNANLVVAKMGSEGKCIIEICHENCEEDVFLLFNKQTTKPKKLVFEVDGKTLKYKSIRKAAEGLGVARPTLTNIVNGHTKRSLALESAGIKFIGEE